MDIRWKRTDEVLVSHEEMRRAQERKDHFVIFHEKDFDTTSLKKSIKTIEYGSGTVKHQNAEELKAMMKKLNLVL